MNHIAKNKKKVLSMALAASMAVAPVNAIAASSDISGHWAEKTITEWQDKGLISGYEDGTFQPNKSTTRAEFARMMNQALGLNTLGSVSFSDVSARDWFYNDVAIAIGEAYTAGYPDGTFKPNETITRAQAAVFIANAINASVGATPDFTDASNIPAWAKDAVGAVVANGYMSGYPDGSFQPNAVLTRAEAVSTLNRIMGEEPEKEEVVNEKDIVIEKDDTKLEDQTVEGNVTISEKVGDGEVYLSNVEIKGDLIIQGGGDDSIYLSDTTVAGKTILDKKNVRVQVSGKTELPTVEIKKAANLNAKNFEGEVGRISISAEITDKITIDAPADKLYVDNKANVLIKSDIIDVIVDEDAEGTKVEVASDAKVTTLTADGKVALSGSGKISTLEANVDGITYSSNLTISDTETAKDVKEPTKSNGSNGGGGSGSESSTKRTSSPTIDIPTAGAETITGTATAGATVTVTIGEGESSITKTATANKDNGKWSVEVDEALTAGVKISAVAKVSGRKTSNTVTVTVKTVEEKTDVEKVAADKALIEAGTYEIPLTSQTTQEAKTAWVQSAVDALIENGTTAVVTYSESAYAVELTLNEATGTATITVTEEV